MFKNLLGFWKGRDFLSQVLVEFKNMLNDAQDMYDSVRRKLVYNEKIIDLEGKIYRVDEKINGLQKDIRKRIIEHLSLQPSVDVSACLVLMSVVKDAERLGDYCKNLFEVTRFLNKPVDKGIYEGLFDNIDNDILELFKLTKDAYVESDEKKAQAAWQYETRISKTCDAVVEQLAKSDLSVNEAVCFTLTARHFKRLAAHLTNIATSVILPIDELDFFDEKTRKKEK